MSVGALPRRRIGTTGVEVTVLGLGGAPLGNLFEEIPAERALATVRAALDAGIGWFDVAPFYGHGLAEHRFGHVLRKAPRDAFVLSTKTGRLLRAADAIDPSPFKGCHHFAVVHDYSYDATMRSLEDSLQRLGMGRIDVALIHDVDPMHQGDAYEARFAEAVNGACRALAEAKAAGAIGAWGIGVNQVEPCLRFATEADLDCVMLARCYTLLEQEGVPELLDLAEAKGFSLLVAGPFGSGVLASGAVQGAVHNYAAASPATLNRVRRMAAVCARHGTSLKAAALHFPLGHPRVAAVAAGAVAPEQVTENARLMRAPVPDDLWAEMKRGGLLDPALATPKAGG